MGWIWGEIGGKRMAKKFKFFSEKVNHSLFIPVFISERLEKERGTEYEPFVSLRM